MKKLQECEEGKRLREQTLEINRTLGLENHIINDTSDINKYIKKMSLKRKN